MHSLEVVFPANHLAMAVTNKPRTITVNIKKPKQLNTAKMGRASFYHVGHKIDHI